jgi:beta-galactosidase
MWFHLELRGQGYRAARAAVAISDRITGPYTFVASSRPNGNMSRDMTIYQDEDGSAYIIYTSRDNFDMRIAKLSNDCLSVGAEDKLLFSDHREAPAIFKYDHQYYLMTSACTGWKPNKMNLYNASSLWGPWQRKEQNPLKGPGADSTFGGQPTYVLPVAGKKNAFIFLADKWNPSDLTDSRYLWLPVQLTAAGPHIEWANTWKLSFFDGK